VGGRDRGQADGRCADHIELAGDLAAEPVGDIDIRQGEERARLLKTVEFDPKLGASDGGRVPYRVSLPGKQPAHSLVKRQAGEGGLERVANFAAHSDARGVDRRI